MRYENGDLDCHRTRIDVEPHMSRAPTIRSSLPNRGWHQTQSAVALPGHTLALRHITGRPHALELLDAPAADSDGDKLVIFTLRLEALERPAASVGALSTDVEKRGTEEELDASVRSVMRSASLPSPAARAFQTRALDELSRVRLSRCSAGPPLEPPPNARRPAVHNARERCAWRLLRAWRPAWGPHACGRGPRGP